MDCFCSSIVLLFKDCGKLEGIYEFCSTMCNCDYGYRSISVK